MKDHFHLVRNYCGRKNEREQTYLSAARGDILPAAAIFPGYPRPLKKTYKVETRVIIEFYRCPFSATPIDSLVMRCACYYTSRIIVYFDWRRKNQLLNSVRIIVEDTDNW